MDLAVTVEGLRAIEPTLDVMVGEKFAFAGIFEVKA